MKVVLNLLRVGSARDSWRKNVQSGQPWKSPDVICMARNYLLRRFGYTLKRGRERDRADEEESDDVLETGDASGSIWRVTSARRKIWMAMIG
ncbi:Hexosyltransferase [Psidium guajava]|nr:Hexosyltransferase [Psidium guajava]